MNFPEHELLLLSALTEARSELRAATEALAVTTCNLADAVGREQVLIAQLEERNTAIAEAQFRTEALQIVLSAALACTGRFGLNRVKFRRMVSEAGRTIPDDGPASVQHYVLLSEARKVLDIHEYPA